MYAIGKGTLAIVALSAALTGTPAHADTLTKSQVIARGSAICKKGERAVNALPQIRSQHPFSAGAPAGDRARAIRFLGGYADALEGVRVGLARLAPPVQGRRLLEGFIGDLRPTVAMFRKAHLDATAGRYDDAESEAQRAFVLFAKASAQTAAYGFPKGVCQSGSSN